MKTLRETVEIYKGRKAPEVFNELLPDTKRYLQIEDLRPDTTFKYARDPDGVTANKDDVIVAWDGANAGTVSFGLDGYVGSTLAILRPKEKDVYAPFLGYFLQSKFKYIREQTTGATIPHINRDSLERLALEIPPLPEQRRIAALLDKADRLRRTRRYAAQLGDTFLQTVFVRMFGDPVRNPMGWDIQTIGDLLTFITSGSRGYAKYYREEGDIFLRIENVGRGRLLLDDLVFVQPPDDAESKRISIKSGDLLVSMTADLGRSAVTPDDFPKAYINQHLGLLRLKNINPIFVSGYMTSPDGQLQFRTLDRGGVKSGLNFDDIRGYKIFVPLSALQEKYVRVVQQFERLRAQQREAERQAEHLFQTLLQKSFA